MSEAASAPGAGNICEEMNTLFREHYGALQEIIDAKARELCNAYDACMAEMAKIEAEAADAERTAFAAVREAETKTAAAGAESPNYREFHKQVADACQAARDRAEEVRKDYRAKWTALQDELEDLRHKARLDFLDRVRDVWIKSDIHSLDPEKAAAFAQLVRCGISPSTFF